MKKIVLLFFIFPIFLFSIKIYDVPKVENKKNEKKDIKKNVNNNEIHIEKIYKLKYVKFEEISMVIKNYNIKYSYANGYLIMKGLKKDIDNIVKILEKVDVIKKQVLIKINMIEISKNLVDKIGISLNKTNDTNISNLFKNGKISIVDFIGLGGVSVSIDLLKENGEINVSSSTEVLVVDGEKATFSISDDNKIVQTKNSTISQEAGIILNIVPRIVYEDFFEKIELDIKYEASQFSNSKNNLSKHKNYIDTKIILVNKRFRFIGSLNENIEKNTEGSIPILSDIPLIGRLFENKNKMSVNKNIYIEVKGEIINDE